MEIYVNPASKMGQTGSSLLKLIQNTTLPVIDLIVREGLQNSLDAALNEHGAVQADFITGNCEKSRVDQIFSGISEALQKNIAGDRVDFLALRDKGTAGLSGPLREDEYEDGCDHGNLRKLIYEICQAQTSEGKGGSWGLGKTVFFRAGIGIVMYYSRIRTDAGFEERLAATLIENDKDSNSLLRQSNLKNGRLFTGVAWWGACDNKDTWPITESQEIRDILSVFNISPYTGEETGTTVIVPYIDRKKLCNNADTAGGNSVFASWSLEDFITEAVQRWYLPRLYNKEYKKYGAWLDFRLNGKKYRKPELEPFFCMMQELYNEAPVKGIPIRLNSVFAGRNKNAGYLAIRKFTQSELGDNTVPHILLNKAEDCNGDEVPPIVAFCRKAGMVINYDTDGPWTAAVPATKKGEYVAAFFVLNSEAVLSDGGMTLDAYIRSAEQADHMNWFDSQLNGKQGNIVTKIQKNSAKKLQDKLRPAEKENDLQTDTRLQQKLGSLFMPPDGFGKAPSIKQHGNTSRGRSNSAGKSGLDMRNVNIRYIEDNSFIFSWQVSLKKRYPQIVQELSVTVAQGKPLFAAGWEDETEGIGTPFPFDIEKVSAICDDEIIDCRLLRSEAGSAYAFTADTSSLAPSRRKNCEIQCEIKVRCYDKSLTCHIVLQEGAK